MVRSESSVAGRCEDPGVFPITGPAGEDGKPDPEVYRVTALRTFPQKLQVLALTYPCCRGISPLRFTDGVLHMHYHSRIVLGTFLVFTAKVDEFFL